MLTIIAIISLLQISLKTAYDLHEVIRNLNKLSYSVSVIEIPTKIVTSLFWAS